MLNKMAKDPWSNFIRNGKFVKIRHTYGKTDIGWFFKKLGWKYGPNEKK